MSTDLTYEQLTSSPIPVWFAEVNDPWGPPEDPIEHWIPLVQNHGSIAFRGTSLTNLDRILATGVDVTPTDATIYAAAGAFDKAYEYGKHPKVVIAYKADLLDRTYRTLPLDATDNEIAAHAEVFPHRYVHNNTTWLSRIDHDHIPAGPTYEQAYAFWHPGDPRDALVGLFTYGTQADKHNVLTALGL